MFRKKNKKNDEPKLIEEQKQEESRKDISEAFKNYDKVKQKKSSKFFRFGKKTETKKAIPELVEEITEAKYNWVWANTQEYEEKLEKANRKTKRRRFGKKKVKEEESVVIEEPSIIEKNNEEVLEVSEEPQIEELKEPRKELSSYFEKNKTKTKKLRKKDKRKDKKETAKDDSGKTSKRQSRRDKVQEDIINQKVFKYNNKKYTKIEDFITYLNAHFLDIEQIAEEVLDDENFFGWINNNSGIFNQSLKEFKEIKAKIENK